MEDNNKKILNRLKRIEGQVRGVHNMIKNDRYCMDVLTQLSSVSSAINGVEDIILRRHLDSCVSAAIKSGKELEKKEKLDEVMKFLNKFRR
ncbi:MAG: metal-sensitive transcriptional regulator [Nitrospinota bacterium]|jgi:DNA-binding FrmR family transcriptional regulator|nr:transcriptional regulator [Nitrospinota bacterium]MDP7350084.1 metal-sensitive transcriptional regulator [Nitrospinota bacterium]MDP7579950.1 metal-sensitive transcriptional regulator [Nitrospinota bacterium]HJN02160.1 metal-sensitive transcriptional regulator [Nitrospinota bacterium]